MKLFIWVLLAISLVSCSLVPSVPGGAPSALVHTKKKGSREGADNLTIQLFAVDGRKVRAARTVRLTPGQHILKFSFYRSNGGIAGYSFLGEGESRVTLRDGGIYRFEGKGFEKHVIVKLVETKSFEVAFSKKVPYQSASGANDTFLQDFTNQMMVPYNTGVY